MRSSNGTCIAILLPLVAVTAMAAAAVAQEVEPPMPPPLPRYLTIDDYRAQIEGALPQFGPDVLDAPDGEDWLAGVSVERIAAAVQDLPPPELVYQEGPLTEARDQADTRFIKIDLSRGRIRWSSGARQFRFESSPRTVVGEPQAAMITNAVADALNLPSNERDSPYIDIVMSQSFGPDGPRPAIQRERLVSMHRVVNGYPVFESLLRLAISNEGQPARLLVRWPRFVLPADLSMLPRSVVVNMLAASVWEVVHGAAVEMHITIAYAPAGSEYLPVAVAAINDTRLGTMCVVPLVDVPFDEDFDGVADAVDNCLREINPGQQDRDQDGVGDLCDNCPDTPNPGQLDSDEDGTGNACEEIEGACLISAADDGCEMLTPAACAALEGDYQGDGTSCREALSGTPEAGSSPSVIQQVKPNPFNPRLEIRFYIASDNLGAVTVDVLDVRGRVVQRLLVQDVRLPGYHSLDWDGRDDQGRVVASGVYLVRVVTRAGTEVEKVSLIR